MGRNTELLRQNFEQWFREYVTTMDQYNPFYSCRKHIVEKVMGELMDKDLPLPLKILYDVKVTEHEFRFIVTHLHKRAIYRPNDEGGFDWKCMSPIIDSVMSKIGIMAVSLQ